MPAHIYKFPEFDKVNGYKIPLYTDEEIFVTIAALNIFCPAIQNRVTNKNLTEYDPIIVIDALVSAKNSDIFSQKTKSVISRILKSIEQIEIRL